MCVSIGQKEMWPFQDTDSVFREAVEREFAPLAKECGSNLQKVESMIFGFRTPYAVLTVGAYAGHFRSICVKIRPRTTDEDVSVRDGIDIGLANIELFLTGRLSEIYTQRKQWSPEPIREEIEALARKVREVAMPFLTKPDANWIGVRTMIAERIKKMSAETPWLDRYRKNE
jgi:hypothetical protein